MKTQTWAVKHICDTEVIYVRHYYHRGVGCSFARLEYVNNRRNWPMSQGEHLPGDGKYTWIIGKVQGEVVEGVKGRDGYYHYEVRYDEGPKDKEFMENGDWEHIRDLMRAGKLLEVEPNADRELAPDHKYRAEITRALDEARASVGFRV